MTTARTTCRVDRQPGTGAKGGKGRKGRGRGKRSLLRMPVSTGSRLANFRETAFDAKWLDVIMS